MKVRVIAASVAALATMGFASSAMAASAEAGQVVVGPAGYAQGPGTLVIAGGVPVPIVGPGDHVVICHALGEANKDTYIQIAPSAGVVFGHAGAGHQIGEDIIPPFIYQPNGNQDDDSSLAEGQNWDAAHIAVYQNGCAALPPAPPTDLCPNLDGNQDSVPAGMIKDEAGDCVTPAPPTDVCPNIDGDQDSVPGGMVKDGNGNCYTQTISVLLTDGCPNLDGAQASVPSGMVKDGAGNCVVQTIASNPSTPAFVGGILGVSTPVKTTIKTPAKVKAKVKAKAKAKATAKVKAKAKVTAKAKAAAKAKAEAKIKRIRVLPFTP